MKLFRRSDPATAAVLMYHRIADVRVDPWELAVSAAHFEEQLQVLKRRHNVISVEELIAALHKKTIPPKSVCITFDDGYGDNCETAKPLLERHNLPATFFIPSYYTGRQQPFWWDELEALILTPPALPQLFQIPISGQLLQFDLEADAMLTGEAIKKHETWVWTATPPTKRCELYLKIWEHLKPLPHAEIKSTLEAIRSWCRHNPVYDKNLLPMNGAQLQELSGNPLFSIGLHTATHPALAFHVKEMQQQEITENSSALQRFHPVNAIAFPYGSYNNDTISVLWEQGIAAGFTTGEKPVTTNDNYYCLGRFQVKNEDGSTFKRKLDAWLHA
jgi:peptidoglycan/xylan/chitin deacetylase (PgdA/CDA1 family)